MKVWLGSGEERWCAPVAPAALRVDVHHADARTVGTVFTHKAVRVRPVWEVLGHEGNGDRDLRQVLDGTLDLSERGGGGRREHV